MNNSPASRRDFLKHATLAAASAVVPGSRLFGSGATGNRPNLLLIMTDQQFADTMSCAIGRRHLHTPNMDSLAAGGMRFTRAYTGNPLCVPARTSMFTGRYPHETGIQTNTNEKIDPDRYPCMGRIFQAADTVVVFLSDHGECHGAHRWNQKTVFYDESARVPLIVSRKGTIPTGTCDSLVHTGVDLIPTLFDFAGLETPKPLPGRSFQPHPAGHAVTGREYLVVSNHMVQCEPVEGVLLQPQGRMVRSDQYKYCLYDLGQRRESLVDMKQDPGEMKNLAGEETFRPVLLRHREYLRSFAEQYRDNVALAMLKWQALQ